MYKITHANIKDWAKNYTGEPFDGILCDPPYELGFMGKSWDSSGIAFDKDMWSDLLRILKPGGHLLAFSGSRTYHRMAVAIEDAGFEIRDMIEWVYGSGFPKSLNIGKAVDKLQGNKREIVRERSGAMNNAKNSEAQSFTKGDVGFKTHFTETKGTSEWEGYGTALKPAHEPCVLARKPLDGTVANNVLKHGTGGLNIDGSRVGYTSESDMESAKWGGAGKPPSEASWKMQSKIVYDTRTPLGRFPANLIHDGSDEVEAVFPQTGKGNGGKPFSYSGREYDNKDSSMFNGDKPQAPSNFNDSGSASRFFYCAKASKRERNAGLDGFEVKGKVYNGQSDTGAGKAKGSVEDKFSTQPSANHHPTVKPLSLTKYLATLIKPPTGGRLLVPFSGSGSEMIGALQAGWEYVEGVELTEEYIPIAEARIMHWTSQPNQEKLI